MKCTLLCLIYFVQCNGSLIHLAFLLFIFHCFALLHFSFCWNTYLLWVFSLCLRNEYMNVHFNIEIPLPINLLQLLSSFKTYFQSFSLAAFLLYYILVSSCLR